MLQGISASPGHIIGKTLIYKHNAVEIDEVCISEADVDTEISCFFNAREATKKQIEAIKERALEKISEDSCRILDAHIMVLEDVALQNKVLDRIKHDKMKAEAAAHRAMQEICKIFAGLDDPYMRERADDIRDVVMRIICNIKGIGNHGLCHLDEPVILVTDDLSPSDTVQMDKDKILGIIVNAGGRTSHSAIIARSMEIPAVVGTRNATEIIRDGELVIIDGTNGTVLINPSNAEIRNYETRRKTFLDGMQDLAKYSELEAVTRDGRRVEISANVGSLKDIDAAIKYGADGVGLFRSEFLYMEEQTFPSEESQFKVYKEAAEKMGRKPVIIRTLDIGGDKDLPYIDFEKEQNPFLGWRAIRMCLDMPEMFKTQLRAILRASAYGDLLIMYPMIISMEELRRANSVLDEAKCELRSEKISFNENIQIGIMIETPAAAIIAEYLIQEVDFFSIGTNDLTQYTLAVDRGNERISDLYQPFHPAVIKLIKHVIDVSHEAGKWTGMCGELAGNENAALLLLGLGLDEFSMSAISMLKVRKAIINSSYIELKTIASEALALDTTSGIQSLTARLNKT